MEDEGSVLKYMTKFEIEAQRSSLLIMTQCLFWRKVKQIETLCNPLSIGFFLQIEARVMRFTKVYIRLFGQRTL